MLTMYSRAHTIRCDAMRCDNRCNAMLNAIYKCKMGIHALYINTTNITTASNKMATLFVRHNIYALLQFVHTYLWEKNLLLASVHTYPASSWECISLSLSLVKSIILDTLSRCFFDSL